MDFGRALWRFGGEGFGRIRGKVSGHVNKSVGRNLEGFVEDMLRKCI